MAEDEIDKNHGQNLTDFISVISIVSKEKWTEVECDVLVSKNITQISLF